MEDRIFYPLTRLESTKSEARSSKQIQMIHRESTKSEYLNSKQIQMTKTNAMFQTTVIRIPRFGIAWVLTYLAAVCFEFRVLDFEFTHYLPSSILGFIHHEMPLLP